MPGTQMRSGQVLEHRALCCRGAAAPLPAVAVRATHHLAAHCLPLPPQDVPALYAGLYAQLAPGGCAVTITRPQEVDYPLFARAREVRARLRCAGSTARCQSILWDAAC